MGKLLIIFCSLFIILFVCGIFKNYLVTPKELVDFGKKWLEEAAEKLSNSDLDRILNSLNENSYTFGHICALIAKLAKLRNNDEIIEFINRITTTIHTFNDIQIFWAPDICDF